MLSWSTSISLSNIFDKRPCSVTIRLPNFTLGFTMTTAATGCSENSLIQLLSDWIVGMLFSNAKIKSTNPYFYRINFAFSVSSLSISSFLDSIWAFYSSFYWFNSVIFYFYKSIARYYSIKRVASRSSAYFVIRSYCSRSCSSLAFCRTCLLSTSSLVVDDEISFCIISFSVFIRRSNYSKQSIIFWLVPIWIEYYIIFKSLATSLLSLKRYFIYWNSSYCRSYSRALNFYSFISRSSSRLA